MGRAQCTQVERAMRLGYVAVFVLVLIYAETPRMHLLLRAMLTAQ